MSIYHFIYKVTNSSGKYYIGRHTTKDLEDNYLGSGKWIRSLKDKTDLKREILEFCSEDNLLETEKKYLMENVGLPNCMNFNTNPVGFASGKNNPRNLEKNKEKYRNLFLGDNNPAKRPEIAAKISAAQKGKSRPKWKMSEQGRINVSNGRKGIKYSEEGKRKLSESRKRDYALGKRLLPNWKKIVCQYCNKNVSSPNYYRWHGEKCKLKNHSISHMQ